MSKSTKKVTLNSVRNVKLGQIILELSCKVKLWDNDNFQVFQANLFSYFYLKIHLSQLQNRPKTPTFNSTLYKDLNWKARENRISNSKLKKISYFKLQWMILVHFFKTLFIVDDTWQQETENVMQERKKVVFTILHVSSTQLSILKCLKFPTPKPAYSRTVKIISFFLSSIVFLQ